MSDTSSPHVVVVGGGFGGLEAVKKLARAGVRVTLLDRHNYHLFQPLTYQVATGGLAPGDIAVPLRHVLRRYPHVTVLMGEVLGFDLEAREVQFKPPGSRRRSRLAYDGLIVAAGSNYSYFGHDEWRSTALEVKSLDSATEVRGRILAAFEAAECHPEEAADWLTFVVVGAGPTGVEIAGQIAELARSTLAGEFRHIDPGSARVLLVEIADHVMGAFSAPLPNRAERALEQLGVTLMLSHTVVDVRPDGVELRGHDGETTQVPAHTVVWAAGVTASPLAAGLGEAADAGVDRSGRITVEPDLSLAGHPEVLAIGDMVAIKDPQTGQARALPGLAPVAMQQGRYAGAAMARRLAGSESAPFQYHDKGSMATIGRARAVVQMGPIRFWGFPAWIVWLVVHIFYLIGFENRVVVMLRWAYGYFTRRRGNRLITVAIRAGASSRRRGRG
jgi:NADH:ubiquinone reductase (H+-translocating)